jgi:LAO/AO transport system kinase
MNKRNESALKVMAGVEQPVQINPALVDKLKSKRSKTILAADYVAGIRSGNRSILSQAITLIESSLPKDQEVAQEIIGACLSAAGGKPSYRIGITGVPGVGKSTFIEALGKHLTTAGHKVAVLAIDPSSSRSKGSILGDKTRMEELSSDPHAFIRPSPSAGSLGGVARKTRETIVLCEAAGFDVIFIETVGVGQSETAVHSMVDFFLLLMLAGAGDELQGIKRGIIEMSDAIFVNKADGENEMKAKRARSEYANALHLFPPTGSGWTPVAGICSAQTKMGIDTIWDTILEHRKVTMASGHFLRNRQQQEEATLFETIEAELKKNFYDNDLISKAIPDAIVEIRNGRISPYRAAQQLLGQYFRQP